MKNSQEKFAKRAIIKGKTINNIQNKLSGYLFEVLKNIFNHFGYPTEIRCDNSLFGSFEFQEYSI